jgi:hypothetical protein
VGNEAGFRRHLPFWDREWHSDFKEAIKQVLPHQDHNNRAYVVRFVDRDVNAWRETDAIHRESRWAEKASKRFQRRSVDTRKPARLIGMATTNPNDKLTELQTHGVTLAANAQVPALKHDCKTFIYTDGSFVDDEALDGPGIGAAVYVPASQNRSARTWHIDCLQRPGESTSCNTNTIYRAELVAIHVAITEAPSPSQGTIGRPSARHTHRQRQP